MLVFPHLCWFAHRVSIVIFSIKNDIPDVFFHIIDLCFIYYIYICLYIYIDIAITYIPWPSNDPPVWGYSKIGIIFQTPSDLPIHTDISYVNLSYTVIILWFIYSTSCYNNIIYISLYSIYVHTYTAVRIHRIWVSMK